MGYLLELVRDEVATVSTLAELAAVAHFRWRVRYLNGQCIEVRVLPEQARRFMTERYPEATVEPLPATESDE